MISCNGLPLVVIELKKPGVPARAAFDENPTHYKQKIPALFCFNALLVGSNGADHYSIRLFRRRKGVTASGGQLRAGLAANQ